METTRSVAPKPTNGFFWVCAVLTIIGAINWGLVGFFNWNLVDAIFGGGAREDTSDISRIVYAIVGLAGVALAVWLARRASERSGSIGSGRHAEVIP